MKTSDFSFKIPEKLIAQYPAAERGTSQLLILNRKSGKTSHNSINNLPDIIEPGTVVVFNNSRVRKARLFGKSETGGTVEFLLIKEIDKNTWQVIVSKTKKQKIGKTFFFPNSLKGTITREQNLYRIISFNRRIDDAYLDKYGHIPLPPYIKRGASENDASRYQTVYSNITGSIAAPTAGLHFTDDLLERLKKQNINIGYVTLHVGIGTFTPIRTENIEDHIMHEEQYIIPTETAQLISSAKEKGNKILAVGTSTVRTLESSWENGKVKSGENKTNLYIYPGYKFKVIDQMLTNFHTPESTLFLMVSAFSGNRNVLNAYKEAVKKSYMFFSYGDVMLIQ